MLFRRRRHRWKIARAFAAWERNKRYSDFLDEASADRSEASSDASSDDGDAAPWALLDTSGSDEEVASSASDEASASDEEAVEANERKRRES